MTKGLMSIINANIIFVHQIHQISNKESVSFYYHREILSTACIYVCTLYDRYNYVLYLAIF